MPCHKLTFINHACFMVESDSALLLVDPWLEGPAFNNGWSLLDQSTSNEALIAQLNCSGLPVYIWYSHEHPDHFSIPFLKKFKEQFRGIATFLFQQTLDRRVVGFLRKNGFDVAECAEGEPFALGPDMRITIFPYSDGDSFCLINCSGHTILNLNDCALTTEQHCIAVKAKLKHAAPRIDLLLTQFGYANWVGNPDQPHLHRNAAHEKIHRIGLQLTHFKPKIVVPFASFVYFSHHENAYLNANQNTPQAVALAPQLAKHAHTVRFLRPGSTIDLDKDSAASLTPEHEQALAHWMGLLEKDRKLLPPQPEATLSEVKSAFSKYRSTMVSDLHGLPRLFEFARRIVPLNIHLSDLEQTVQVSYRQGWKVLEPGAPFDVSMSSNNAVFLFKNEYGFDTTHVNGRFRLARPEALGVFSRFFLPQRMAKNGYDRRNPLRMLRYLARNVAGRIARQVQSALKLS